MIDPLLRKRALPFWMDGGWNQFTKSTPQTILRHQR
jgi:hypothetical protein